MAANGFGVVQVLAGTCTGTGGGAVGIETGIELGCVGGFGVEVGGVMPGGHQPPFQHVPPPMLAKGSGPVQPVGGGGGGGGVLGGGGVGVDPPDPVAKTASGDTLRMPFQLTDRTRK